MTQPEKENADKTVWRKAAFGGGIAAIVYYLLAGAGLGMSLLVGFIAMGAFGVSLKRRSNQAAAAAETVAAATSPAPRPVAAEAVTETQAEELAAEVVESEAAPQEASLVKPGTILPGEAELASRKGSWRYEGNSVSV